jgi:hypothetical protein
MLLRCPTPVVCRVGPGNFTSASHRSELKPLNFGSCHRTKAAAFRYRLMRCSKLRVQIWSGSQRSEVRTVICQILSVAELRSSLGSAWRRCHSRAKSCRRSQRGR